MRRSAQTRGPSGWVEPRAGGGGGRGGAQALRRRRRPGTARRGRGRRCLRVPRPPPASPSPRLLAGGWSAPGPGRGPPINPDLVARASPGSRSREERQRGGKVSRLFGRFLSRIPEAPQLEALAAQNRLGVGEPSPPAVPRAPPRPAPAGSAVSGREALSGSAGRGAALQTPLEKVFPKHTKKTGNKKTNKQTEKRARGRTKLAAPPGTETGATSGAPALSVKTTRRKRKGHLKIKQ